jgi:hypothetical protein
MMSKDPAVDQAAIVKCQEVGGAFFDDILARTDVGDFSRNVSFEQSNMDCFKEVYRGKRSQHFITTKVESYERYCKGLMKPSELKAYLRCSCFIKFESNVKDLGAEGVRGRPRMIMTMSDLMLMELVQMVPVIHALYAGPLSEYQIKGLSMEGMAAQVEFFSAQGAMVTDVSSFESSMIHGLRKIENRVFTDLLMKAGLPLVEAAYRKHYFMGPQYQERKLHSRWGIFECDTRNSGDFITSAGNGILNISFSIFCLSLYQQAQRDGRAGKLLPSDNTNFPPVDTLIKPQIIAEGDDGLVIGDTRKAVTKDNMALLGIKFSSEVDGTRAGDVDFLRTLWQGGRRYLNVGRALSIFWVKKGHNLRRGKQLWLLRQAALSLHHQSPHHPVLAAVVWRIARATNHVRPFKNWESYLDAWKERPNGPFPAVYRVDETMRERIAMGAIGFPPISIANQVTLEDRILNHAEVYVGKILEGYEDIDLRVDSVNERCIRDTLPMDITSLLMNLRESDGRVTPSVADNRLVVEPSTQTPYLTHTLGISKPVIMRREAFSPAFPAFTKPHPPPSRRRHLLSWRGG